MGVDGPGIFDNDSCGDFLGDICDQLVEAVRTDVATFENGYLERTAPAAISVLLGIAKHIPLVRAFIDPMEIAALRDRYLKWFDASMHESGGTAEFLQQWRGGAEQEFNALIAICSKK